MLLILQKKVPGNAWDYPDTPNFFIAEFTIDADPEADPPILRQDIFKYSGTLTLAQLNAAVSYTVLEYTDEVPAPTNLPVKRISMSDIIITLPIQTKMQLEDVKDIAFGGGSPTAEEIEDGYKADFTLTYLMLGRDINTNAEKFIEMMDFMVANSVIGVTQEHVDTLVNDITEETRDL